MQEINIPQAEIRQINRAIMQDSKFLAHLKIMDYSLLLGIESKFTVQMSELSSIRTAGRTASISSMVSSVELKRFKRHRFTSSDGTLTYHISIIDFLQLWNLNKKSEQFAKTTFLRAEKAKLSAIEPQAYMKRF